MKEVKNIECQVEDSSGNVFKDIGLPDAEILLAKAELDYKINSILKEKKLTLEESEKILALNKAEMAILKQPKMWWKTSFKKLILSLLKLGYDIDIIVKKGKGELQIKLEN